MPVRLRRDMRAQVYRKAFVAVDDALDKRSPWPSGVEEKEPADDKDPESDVEDEGAEDVQSDDEDATTTSKPVSTKVIPTATSISASTSTSSAVTITEAPTGFFFGTQKKSQAATTDDEDDDNSTDDDATTTRPATETITAEWETTATNGATITSGKSAAATSSGDPAYVVQLPPPPPPNNNGGLSEGTEHLLIAAGSIGATILLVLIIFFYYKMRKRGITVREAASGITWPKKRNANAKGGAAMQIRNWTTPAYTWGRKEPFDQGSATGINKTLPTAPYIPIVRTGTNNSATSSRPLVSDVESQKSSSPGLPSRSPSQQQGTFLYDPSPQQPSPLRITPVARVRAMEESPVSPPTPIQPLQTLHEGETTNYQRQPIAQPQPAVPTFKQFLNRNWSSPKVSRFSWGTSQAPDTPRNPNDIRESISSSRSSVPRFRTVDSWVNQQAGRVEQQKLKEQLSGTTEQVPDVPTVPKHYRHETTTSISTDQTVFKQHPGTEVPIPRGSMVPSEILNQKVMGPVL